MNLFISMFNICYAKEEFDLCIGIWGIFLFFFCGGYFYWYFSFFFLWWKDMVFFFNNVIRKENT